MAIDRGEISQGCSLYLVWSETTVYVERLHNHYKQLMRYHAIDASMLPPTQ